MLEPRWVEALTAAIGVMLIAAVVAAATPSIQYHYDTAGRLLSATYPDGTTVTYTLDAAGNRTTMVTKTLAPVTAPTGLVAAAGSASAINLSWSAATGGSGTYTYDVYNATTGALLGTATSDSLKVSGLAPNASYSFTVSAVDSLGNASPRSTTATASTYPLPVISSFSATPISSTQVKFSWAASDVGAQGAITYTLAYVQSGVIATGVTSPYVLTLPALAPGASLQYVLTATDALGDTVSAQASAATFPLPTVTGSAAPVSASSIKLTWTGTDAAGQGAMTYTIHLCCGAGTVANATSPYVQSGLKAAVQYSYSITATDAVGDTVTSQIIDAYTYPTPVANLVLQSVTANSVTLSYVTSDSYGNGLGNGPGVTFVNLYENGSNVAGSNNPNASFTIAGLSSNMGYTFSLVANDAYGDLSAPSVVTATTAHGADTPTMVAGATSNRQNESIGYQSGVFGSMSPATTSTGLQYDYLIDLTTIHVGTSAYFALKGLTADPGSAWLTSISANGITVQGTGATYSYDASVGIAVWVWTATSFGFVPGSTYPCTIVHQ